MTRDKTQLEETLEALIDFEEGLTARHFMTYGIDRVAEYIRQLRKNHSLSIDTINEQNKKKNGTHARYILRSPDEAETVLQFLREKRK